MIDDRKDPKGASPVWVTVVMSVADLVVGAVQASHATMRWLALVSLATVTVVPFLFALPVVGPAFVSVLWWCIAALDSLPYVEIATTLTLDHVDDLRASLADQSYLETIAGPIYFYLAMRLLTVLNGTEGAANGFGYFMSSMTEVVYSVFLPLFFYLALAMMVFAWCKDYTGGAAYGVSYFRYGFIAVLVLVSIRIVAPALGMTDLPDIEWALSVGAFTALIVLYTGFVNAWLDRLRSRLGRVPDLVRALR